MLKIKIFDVPKIIVKKPLLVLLHYIDSNALTVSIAQIYCNVLI